MAYKYTGKERDTTIGLYFSEARYYDPILGRFISPDTMAPPFAMGGNVSKIKDL